MKLIDCAINKNYVISEINANEEGMGEFLFTLGCYPGEIITILSQVSSSYIINVKDARYSIDKDLASAIRIQETEDLEDCKSLAV